MVLLLLVACAGGGWWFYQTRQAAAQEKEDAAKKGDEAVPVTLASAGTADFPVALTGLGTVEAINNVTVRSQVSGRIMSVHFREGQLVNEGDLLVEIDPRPLQAALAQAQAKRAQDQANFQDSQVNLSRIQELAKKEFASRQQLDTQTSLVNQNQALLQADDAAIQDAQTQLSYASIRSPISGRVGFRLVDVGSVVGASDTTGIVNIQQVQPISVVFTAPEDALPQITRAIAASEPRVTALSSDGATTLAVGKLSRVNNEVDVASGSIRLKAVFGNESGSLWPGQSVSTALIVDTQKDATVVPVPALQRGPDGLFVYSVGADNKAKMRKVEVGPEDEANAVILKGLEPGERIVTDGQYRLHDGVTVAETKPDGKPAEAAEGDAKPIRTAQE